MSHRSNQCQSTNSLISGWWNRYRNWGEQRIVEQANSTSQLYNLQVTNLTHWKYVKLTDNLRITDLGHGSQNDFQVDLRLKFLETKDVKRVISPSKNGLCGFLSSVPFLKTLLFEAEIWQLLGFAHASNYNILEWSSFTLICQRITKGDLLNYRIQLSRCLESIILTGAKWYQTLHCVAHMWNQQGDLNTKQNWPRTLGCFKTERETAGT